MPKLRSRSVPTITEGRKGVKSTPRGDPSVKGKNNDTQQGPEYVNPRDDGRDINVDTVLHERTRRYHTELLQCKNEFDNLTLKVDYLQDTVCVYRDQCVPLLKRKINETVSQLEAERARCRELERAMYGESSGTPHERFAPKGAEEQENLLDLKTKMRSELLQLRALFVEEVDRLRTKHAHQLQKVRQEHHIEICGMQLLHQEELKAQDDDHKREVHKVMKEKKKELKKEAKKRKKEVGEIEAYLDGIKREKKHLENEAHILQLHKWNTSRSPRAGAPPQPPSWIVPLDVSELPQPLLYDDKRPFDVHRAPYPEFGDTRLSPITAVNPGSFFQSVESAVSTPPYAHAVHQPKYPVHTSTPTTTLPGPPPPAPPAVMPLMPSGGGTSFQQLMSQIASQGQPSPHVHKPPQLRDFKGHGGMAFGPAGVGPQCAAQVQQNVRAQWLHSLPTYEVDSREVKIAQPSPTRAYESHDDR